jgi:hypothetical protein
MKSEEEKGLLHIEEKRYGLRESSQPLFSERTVCALRHKGQCVAKLVAKSITIVAVFIAVMMPSAVGQNKSDPATQQLPSHIQSTEGRLSSAQGVIRIRSGLYYLAPTNSKNGWLSLDKQSYAKQFAGQSVVVRGYFNYDSNSINVLTLQAVTSANGRGKKK